MEACILYSIISIRALGTPACFRRQKKHPLVTANPPLPVQSTLKPAGKHSRVLTELQHRAASWAEEPVSATLPQASTGQAVTHHISVASGQLESIRPPSLLAGRQSYRFPRFKQELRNGKVKCPTHSHRSHWQSRQLSPIFLAELPRKTLFSLQASRRKRAPGISILTGSPGISRFKATSLDH